MPDITIKDVPEGAEEYVQKMAIRAVEIFYRQQLVVPKEIQDSVAASIASFKQSNKKQSVGDNL